MLERLTISDFAGRIGEGFRVCYPYHTETLTLVEVMAGPGSPPAGCRNPFSLFFVGESRTAWLVQRIHPLEHPDFPGLELFLTCLGPDEGGRYRYEADFT